MAIQAQIILPFHVRAHHLLQVIGKVVGEPWSLRSLEGVGGGEFPIEGLEGEAPREDLPRDKMIVFDNRSPSFCVHMMNMEAGAGVMKFTDGGGKEHSWSWFPERPEEDGKMLSPGSHALGIAVCRRLAEFFGGQVCYRDDADCIDLEVDDAQARFGRKKKGMTLKEREVQFTNALLAEPLLTSRELFDAAKVSEAPYEDFGALVAFLDSQEHERQMDTQLPRARRRPAGPCRRF